MSTILAYERNFGVLLKPEEIDKLQEGDTITVKFPTTKNIRGKVVRINGRPYVSKDGTLKQAYCYPLDTENPKFKPKIWS